MSKNNVRTDRFGNAYTVVACKPNKKNEHFSAGYVELGGKLYKLEPSEASKEGVSMWIRVTKVNKNRSNSSM